MDFQKKNWQFNDLITEGELNRMEDGIEEGITKAETAQQTIDTHIADMDVHITPQERQNWNEAYNQAVTEASKQAVTLSRGLQKITTDQQTMLEPKFVGRTLVNLLGAYGNFEKDKNGDGLADEWIKHPNATATLVTDRTLGSFAQRGKRGFTSDPRIMYLTITAIKPSAYYIAIAKLKSVTGEVYIGIEERNSENSFIKANISQMVSDTTKFNIVFTKFQAAATAARFDAGFLASQPDQEGIIDEFRLYEITATEYAALDSMTPEQIAEKYPYVDSVQHVTNPYLIRYGKNLLPPFTEWTLHANAKVEGSYKIKHTIAGSGTNEYNYVDIPAKEGQSYTLSVTSTGSNNRCLFQFRDKNDTVLDAPAHIGSGFQSVTGTAPSGTVKIRVYFYGDPNTAETVTFENPMLNLGSQPLPFVEQNNDYLFAAQDSKGNPLKLASNLNGTVRDELYQRDGQWFKFKRFEADMVLDGSLGWQFSGDHAGFKRIAIPGFLPTSVATANSYFIQKYDGKILKQDNSDPSNWTQGDLFQVVYWMDGGLIITISDTDSGWTETLNPNANAIKALMNGWKATANDGTKYTAWVSILDGSAPAQNTEEFVANNKAPGWEGWAKLTYQLASGVEEPVSVEGEISLLEGENQVEFGEGVIVREPATPTIRSDGNYQINSTFNGASSANYLKRRADSILQIYRNNEKDNLWFIVRGPGEETAGAYGIVRAAIPSLHYDPTAAYTVTYLVLDKYLLTAPAPDATGTYNTNLKTVVDGLVQEVADHGKRISVVESRKANKEQMPWIAPTLLNGWQNYAGFATAGYFKDEFGMVTIKGFLRGENAGKTAETIIFVLPPSFRPKELIHANALTFSLATGADKQSTLLRIFPNGEVRLAFDVLNCLVLNGISFRAEQ